jgi:hypothetical protein
VKELWKMPAVTVVALTARTTGDGFVRVELSNGMAYSCKAEQAPTIGQQVTVTVTDDPAEPLPFTREDLRRLGTSWPAGVPSP